MSEEQIKKEEASVLLLITALKEMADEERKAFLLKMLRDDVKS